MKKLLLTIIGIALASSAAAQSSVNLYGMINIGLGQRNGGTYEGGPDRFLLQDNPNAGSRWGMKGSEDLGGGLKANFQLEAGFKPQSGATKNAFDRQSWVGLSGGWGQFRAGNQNSIVDQILGPYDLNWEPNITSSYGNAGIASIFDVAYGTQRKSQIQYWSPNFGGLTAQLGYINRNDVTPTTNPKSVYSLGLNYEAGKFSAAGAYESAHTTQPGVGANWGVSAKYDFGPVVVSSNYYRNAKETDGRGIGAGFLVPVGNMDFGAQAARNTTASANAWEVFTHYKLSKLTTIFAYYGGMDSNAETLQKATKKNSFTVGIWKYF